MSWPYTTKSRIEVCKDCKNRQVGCHSTCKRYIDAKEQYDKEKNRVNEIKRKESDVRDTYFRGVVRMKNAKNKVIDKCRTK